MKNKLAVLIFTGAAILGFSLPSTAGGIEDLNCSLNSLLGGDCTEIARINKFQDQQQQSWINGGMTATEMVKSVMNYHRSLTPINNYDKELYMYNLQVAQVCDAGKISKEEGLYLMTKKENELSERAQANQPPPNRRLTCVSQSFGGQITTKCD
ncbi:hypothetical protein [Rhodoferax sp.]|uniref:hypothetical protein n=1 Tax=Rhodoferax sp. TaxID=50421 RepID=UPI00272FEF27|nr:hypothetical protein [Rhodoferax sp.]MDP2442491.1 hypothetical protein [Rhodoferax sp.]MDZ4209155.1 hypothetical protein [Rhodoferax sp.]